MELQHSFSHTFAHGVVDPASILISVGGAGSGGDCPWFGCACCSVAAGTGNIVGRLNNISVGTVTYASGGTACCGQASPCITVTVFCRSCNWGRYYCYVPIRRMAESDGWRHGIPG